MSLKPELDAFRRDFLAKVPPEIREAIARALEGITQKAILREL
jgi:hypothetical protein